MRRIIFNAVFVFAFTAVAAVFAQSEIESEAGLLDEAVISDDEQVQPKKKKDKSQNNYDVDESAPPQKAKSKSAEAEVAAEAAVKEETRFKIGGLVEAGFDLHNRKDRGDKQNRVIGRGEVEMSARPVKKVRAEIGIEYDLGNTYRVSGVRNDGTSRITVIPASIVVDKLYGQYNITNDGTFRAGIMKKSFGLEERAGVDERYFHSRSIINGALEDLGFLEHDLTLQYRHELGKTWRFAGGVSWSLDTTGVTSASWEDADTMSYLQNYSVQYTPNESMIYVLAAVVKHLNWSGATTFASSLSFAHTAKPIELLGIESEAEVTFGTSKKRILIQEGGTGRDDPVRESKYVYDSLILGVRVQERFPIDLNSKILRQIIPVAEFAAYSGDMESDDLSMQLRVGLAFGFAKNSAFQLRNTFGTIWDSVDGETNVSRYRWDTEVVLIF